MRTEFLDLPVWDDDELAAVIGEKPVSREKLHHWPLSYVERVDFTDRTVVVKYSKLSRENAFYSSVSAPFLLKPVFMDEIGDTSVTVLPFAEGREPLKNEISSAVELIPGISGSVLWADASDHCKFMELMRDAGNILEKHDPSASSVQLLKKCESFETFFDSIGFVHGDLKPDNILITSSGKPIILDWQRPMKAPLIIDKVTCGLESGTDAQKLAKAFELYWLLYAFDRCLYKLPHVLNWAQKNIDAIMA